MYTIYGIKNCDTMEKAFTWLDQHQVTYQFHNYKTDGLSTKLLQTLLQHVNWSDLLNTRGLTWRKLDETIREQIKAQDDQSKALAIKLMLDNPSIIKRPLLINKQKNQALLGFSAETYTIFTQEGK